MYFPPGMSALNYSELHLHTVQFMANRLLVFHTTLLSLCKNLELDSTLDKLNHLLHHKSLSNLQIVMTIKPVPIAKISVLLKCEH